jgi:glucose 1-dehydrogenase
MRMDKLFEGKTVMISGGMGDIGRAIATEFARNGANVALCDSRPASVAVEFLKDLAHFKISCTYAQVDVSEAEAVAKWVSDTESQIGMASLIIANAATVTLAS